MAEYYSPPTGGIVAFNGIVRGDGAWIPDDPGNNDWIAYQAWVAEGNTAEAWPEPNGPTFVQPQQAAPTETAVPTSGSA